MGSINTSYWLKDKNIDLRYSNIRVEDREKLRNIMRIFKEISSLLKLNKI